MQNSRRVLWTPVRRRILFLPALAIVSMLADSSNPVHALRSAQPEETVRIAGSVPSAARPERDRGAVDANAMLERMIFPLRRRSTSDAELAQLLAQQQDPSSPNFHHWLTPEEFGARFGLSDQEIARVTDWLSEKGFQVEELARGRGWIRFSGTVAQAEEAFQTAIRTYDVDGSLRQSNASEIVLPRRIAQFLAAPIPLSNFHSRPMHRAVGEVPGRVRSGLPAALYTTGSGAHYLAPADFASIYGVTPLSSAGVTGQGVKIAIAGRTNIHVSDVQRFRSQFGLPANDPHIIVNGTDPGVVSTDEESEAELDAEWSGAVAPAAEIDLVVTGDTATTDGITDSSQYIVDHNLASIVSVSFGLCEQYPETQVFNGIWSQAAAQGISVFVASGDDGVAECEDANATTATHGASVNGLCSTPWNVCVGATQLADTDNPSAYWSASNDPVTKGSALGYVPEQVWNESGGTCGALCASGGGASVFYPMPSWQSAPGVPADATHRYVPDVAVSGGTHDGYLTYVNNSSSLSAFGGTSVSTPALAGLFALIVQLHGPQGNPNPRLYQLGSAQFSGSGPGIFHDITSGDNGVPGAMGFPAGPGYDEATGLGSVVANVLAANWSSMAPPSAQRALPIRTTVGHAPRSLPFR
jgi:pseudomonalisin